MLIRQAYETRYGYVNHDVAIPGNPFPLATAHETLRTNFAEDVEIKRLILHDIPKRSGMSIEALFDTPMARYNSIVRHCIEQSKATNALIDQLAESVENAAQPKAKE